MEDTGHRAQVAFDVGADRLDVPFFADGEHKVLLTAMYFHHDWANAGDACEKPFVLIRDHVLLSFASRIAEVDTGVQALPPSPVVDRADPADAAEQELDWLQMMPKDELAALERGEG
ncbi:hypothetical protein ABGA94_14005, partial [Stenotrophomonas sp. 3diitr2024]